MYSYVVCLWVNHTGNSSKECKNVLLKTTLPLNSKHNSTFCLLHEFNLLFKVIYCFGKYCMYYPEFETCAKKLMPFTVFTLYTYTVCVCFILY